MIGRESADVHRIHSPMANDITSVQMMVKVQTSTATTRTRWRRAPTSR